MALAAYIVLPPLVVGAHFTLVRLQIKARVKQTAMRISEIIRIPQASELMPSKLRNLVERDGRPPPTGIPFPIGRARKINMGYSFFVNGNNC